MEKIKLEADLYISLYNLIDGNVGNLKDKIEEYLDSLADADDEQHNFYTKRLIKTKKELRQAEWLLEKFEETFEDVF